LRAILAQDKQQLRMTVADIAPQSTPSALLTTNLSVPILRYVQIVVIS
jgi:hypothetical protein